MSTERQKAGIKVQWLNSKNTVANIIYSNNMTSKRCGALSSSGVSHVEEEKHVTKALQKNRYPISYIRKHSVPARSNQVPDSSGWRASVTLPYLGGLSECLRRVLSPLAIQVTFCPFRTLQQELVHPKDPVPVNRRKGVVYSIPCTECPRAYIRQTGRSLDHQLQEHRRALKNGDVAASAIAEHAFSCNHKVDLSKASVIDAHPHTQTRCMLESWHIQHHPASLNRGKGTMPELYAAL